MYSYEPVAYVLCQEKSDDFRREQGCGDVLPMPQFATEILGQINKLLSSLGERTVEVAKPALRKTRIIKRLQMANESAAGA